MHNPGFQRPGRAAARVVPLVGASWVLAVSVVIGVAVSGQAPATYDLRSDGNVVIPAGWPGSPSPLETPAVGSYIVDPDFGTRVYRLTGPAMSAGSHGTPGGPNHHAVASDDRHLVVNSQDGDYLILNFNPDTGASSLDHRLRSGKDPAFSRVASKPNTIYAPRFNGFMQFNTYDIATRTWGTLLDLKAVNEVSPASLTGNDYQTEIYSSQADSPEVLAMAYGGSEIMAIGSGTHGTVLVTSQAQGDVSGRTVRIAIASGANAALAATDTAGALTITLGTDGSGGVASAAKNTSTLVAAAVDALPGWIGRIPGNSNGTGSITSAMATTNLSGAGAGIQENWIYVTWVNAADASDRATLDLWRGMVRSDGGSWTQIKQHDGTTDWRGYIRLHSMSMDRSGTWIKIDVSGVYGGSARTILWNRVTNRIHDLNHHSWNGHYAMGWHAHVNYEADIARPPQWLFRDLTQGGTQATYRRLINPAETVIPYMSAVEHSNWNNARSDALAPVVVGTTYYPPLHSFNAYITNGAYLQAEIAAVATATGTTKGTDQWYRAASTQMQVYDTGLNGDTATYTQNRWHFRMCPFPQTTHDGRWTFFTSNWNYSLGTYGLLTDHNSSLPAGLPDYRRDVFAVRMSREFYIPQPAAPTRLRMGGGQ